jgi:DNA-binding MarR family transcriptional regulator
MLDINQLEDTLLDYIDQVKVIIAQETWENILLNCTKNELFVLMLLYRKSDVNMTQISEYLNAPLNTTTGIVGRMEKKEMVRRMRSDIDKRVVTIVLTELGRKQIGDIMAIFLNYGQAIIASLDAEELTVMQNVLGKIVKLLKDHPVSQPASETKIRKIVIE